MPSTSTDSTLLSSTLPLLTCTSFLRSAGSSDTTGALLSFHRRPNHRLQHRPTPPPRRPARLPQIIRRVWLQDAPAPAYRLPAAQAPEEDHHPADLPSPAAGSVHHAAWRTKLCAYVTAGDGRGAGGTRRAEAAADAEGRGGSGRGCCGAGWVERRR